MEPSPPGRVEVGLARRRLLGTPEVAHDVVAGALWTIAHGRQKLVRRLAAVQRRDERLHDRRGPVEGARVAPALEKMRLGDVPLAQRRRLVVVQAQLNTERDVVHRVSKSQIDRRAVDRVAADDEEHVDAAGLHVGDEVRQRLKLIDGSGFDGIGVDDGPAVVAEPLVDGMRDRMNDGGLMLAGEDEARASMRGQIADDGVGPFACGGTEAIRRGCGGAGRSRADDLRRFATRRPRCRSAATEADDRRANRLALAWPRRRRAGSCDPGGPDSDAARTRARSAGCPVRSPGSRRRVRR